MTLNEYITITNQRYQTGISREHSYRGDLQHLLQSLLPQILVTNEPAHIDCGAPDYILTRKDVPVGYIEAKDVGTDLASKSLKEQFDRYKSALDNLIFTDYLDFHFYKNGVFVTKIAIGEIKDHKVIAKPENFEQFTNLIQNFAQVVTQSIKSPNKLAQMMAAKAKLMAQVIESALNSDDEHAANTSIKEQMVAFKNILIHDIDNRAFADIYAQTIAYGMFAARYHDPTLPTFSREEAATLIPKSNPFLRKLFQYLAGYDLDERLVWIVDELVQIFLATDVAAIMRNFGKSTRQNDPIIHFYETFLAEYDAKLRKARGVWYTPEPVVNFIVRAVDELLKTKFNLPQGLADTSKTKVMLDVIEPGSKGKSVKKEKELHRVQILDPATGTGTFLAQVVRHIHDSQFASMQGAWPQYVKEHLIPRLNGFELLMTSYAMAHLKLDMLLTETGYKSTDDSERLRIYLTNSLEEHHPDTGTLFASWLSSEANEANHIKRDSPLMIVMGNPPYSGHSSNKGKWIEKLLEAYKQEPSGGKLKEKNPKWLNDDYVKFIRYGQYYVDRNGEGILAFITNNGYLDNPTFRGMRWSLMQSFDDIYLIDLHGNAKKKETAPDGSKDENVFDIMQGVSIALMVKTGKKPTNALANIWHGELYGKREKKYQLLTERSIYDFSSKKLTPSSPQYVWVPRDDTLVEQYQQGFGVQELFTKNSVGIVTARDNFTIHFSPDKLKQTISNFLALDDESARINLSLGKDARDWKISLAREDLKRSGLDYENRLVEISYRPFDSRFTFYTGKSKGFHCMPRGEIMQHFVQKENIGLNWIRPMSSKYAFDIFISKYITDQCSAGNKSAGAGISYLAPLYIYPEVGSSGSLTQNIRTPNLNPTILRDFTNYLGLTFTPEKTDTDSSFCPVDMLDYIYAVLHSPNYRHTYKTFLNTDFPRVPYPTDVAQFWQLVALGGELRKTHLLERPVPIGSQAGAISYPVSDNHLVIKPRFELHGETGRVYINDTQYFEGVPELAWTFYIGGYQPAQKWLKDRKGRALNFEDILHYQKIIHALSETDRLMKRIDTVFTIH